MTNTESSPIMFVMQILEIRLMNVKNKNISSKSQLVIDKILSYIVTNKLRPGDKLQSEEEMARNFNLSRVSVREGLRGLKFLGMLKSTTSRGTVIQEMDFSILARCLGFQIAISDISYRQLLEARLAIEIGALELICGRLSPVQIRKLRKLADSSRKNNSAEEIARDHRLDNEFHKQLLTYSKNEMLISFSKLVEIFFSRIIDDDVLASNAAVSDHEEIVDALEQNNLDLARGIMRQHIYKYYKFIITKKDKKAKLPK